MNEHVPSMFSTRGGARIGFVNYSWPLAQLKANRDQLTVETTMFGFFKMGFFTFAPSEVSLIERFSGVFSSGIRIHHNNSTYPEKVIFWCSPEEVLSGITRAGFIPSARVTNTAESPANREFPFRVWPLVVLIAVWNLVIGYEYFRGSHRAEIPGPPSFLAVLLFFCLAMGTLRSSFLQSIVLKPGRSLGEVRSVVMLVATATGLSAVGLAILLVVRAMNR